MNTLKRISIITGHYGSGKTNIAVNMAVKLRKDGKKVTIVDLDIVNPYFRTADFRDMLEEKGIRLIAPVYANTNLDLPALPAEVNSVFNDDDSYIIIDVGGDDAGAIALGRYAAMIDKDNYDMYYVINRYRYQTKNAAEASELLKEIEISARVKATKLINNSNLGEETTLENIDSSIEFAEEVSRQTGLPIAFTCIKQSDAVNDGYEPVLIYVKPFYIDKE